LTWHLLYGLPTEAVSVEAEGTFDGARISIVEHYTK
jgi:hypothetical protein